MITSVLAMLSSGVTHLGVATDHVIESFRNDMWPGYKSGAEVPETLRAQFDGLEDALRALGVLVWPMVELEADDAMASAAAVAAEAPDVEQVVICTPDKDLAQCVVGSRVVQLDRRKDVVTDENGVRDKFGVSPGSIPDRLGLVGDAADGFPGLVGWGKRSASVVLAHYQHKISAIPDGCRALGPGPAQSRGGGPTGSPPHWPTSARWPSCSRTSPPSASTGPCCHRSPISSGRVPPRRSREYAATSVPRPSTKGAVPIASR